MTVASCLIKLHLPEARSLKDKRQVVRSLLGKLRERHNASVVELDEHRDVWQTAVLGVALAAAGDAEAEARLDRLRRDVEELTLLKYVEFDVAYHAV